MNNRHCLFIAGMFAATLGSHAARLDLTLEDPTLAFDNNGATHYTYNAAQGTGLLTVDAMPFYFLSPDLYLEFNPASDNYVHFQCVLDEEGILVGGAAVTDFEVTGEVDVDMDGVYETSGLLLKGEITQFGFEDSSLETDQFDFRVSLTGGALAYLYAGKNLGINLTMETPAAEHVSFLDDFTFDFSGGAKGQLGGIPPLPPGEGVGGVVFCDDDGDGILDPGEAGLPKVKILLVSAGPDGKFITHRDNTRITAVTDENGVYLFENVPVGEEIVLRIGRFAHLAKGTKLSPGSPPKYSFTLAPAEAKPDLDFALLCPTACYCVDEAAACGATRGYAVSLPGIATDFEFRGDEGEIFIYPDGSALITGVVQSRTDARKAFGLQIELDGGTTNPADPSLPAGSPRIEVLPDQCGGSTAVSTAGWIYYARLQAQLVGQRSMDGVVFDLTAKAPAFQIGAGANGRNRNLGGAGFFTWTMQRQKRNCGVAQTGQGEFRFDFETCSAANHGQHGN